MKKGLTSVQFVEVGKHCLQCKNVPYMQLQYIFSEHSGQDFSIELGVERFCFYQLNSASYKNILLINKKKPLKLSYVKSP